MIITLPEGWDVPIENLSCERELGNIHNTLTVAITKDGTLLPVVPISAAFFQTSDLVINLRMDS